MPIPLEWWQEWSEGWFILGAPYAALRAPLTITDPCQVRAWVRGTVRLINRNHEARVFSKTDMECFRKEIGARGGEGLAGESHSEQTCSLEP